MFCGQCGTKMEEGQTVCPVCGWGKKAESPLDRIRTLWNRAPRKAVWIAAACAAVILLLILAGGGQNKQEGKLAGSWYAEGEESAEIIFSKDGRLIFPEEEEVGLWAVVREDYLLMAGPDGEGVILTIVELDREKLVVAPGLEEDMDEDEVLTLWRDPQ